MLTFKGSFETGKCIPGNILDQIFPLCQEQTIKEGQFLLVLYKYLRVLITSWQNLWPQASCLGQISESRGFILDSFLFITVRSQHLKAPYGLNCGSFLAHVIWRSDACHTFGLYFWIIFTGHILRSPRATRMEIPFENVLRAQGGGIRCQRNK